MAYRIEPLRKTSANIFTDYLENIEFGHAPEWATCFCRFYHTTCDQDEWMMRTGETNRIEAVDAIKNGEMQGFLAFDGEKCIGWLNANDASAMVRLKDYLKPVIKEQKVGCTICYVIHPEYRGKGVARELLKVAIEHFKDSGYDAMLALPVDGGEAEKHYRGTLNMYLENGYVEIESHDSVKVMWLSLK